MIALGWALARRPMAAWPRWSEPLSTMTNTRGALVYSGLGELLPDRPGPWNGTMPVVAGVAANTVPAYVQAGQQRECPVVDVLDAPPGPGLPGAGGKVAWMRPRAWMDGLASKDKILSPGPSGSPP